jgi:hypothetical protein
MRTIFLRVLTMPAELYTIRKQIYKKINNTLPTADQTEFGK